MSVPVRWSVIDSAFGPILLASTDRGLALLHFVAGAEASRGVLSETFPGAELAAAGGAHAGVERELADYFRGERDTFTVRLDLTLGTAFQRRVWAALLRIPCGETRSYGEVARAIGASGAARAVGMACRRNRVGLVVPCHRVVGSSGDLTGYAGGLSLKQRLLAHEARLVLPVRTGRA